MASRIRVSEIFGPTVQGEGPLIGRPTVFVRTGGCDYRCSWCDTLYAVLPEYAGDWQTMTEAEILDEVAALTGGRPILISLSGGNPAMQPLAPLIAAGRAAGHGFSLETQASLPRAWFADLDWLLLSPKPPSSGETLDWQALADCRRQAGAAKVILKVTVFDETDYRFARQVAERHPDLPFTLQVGNRAPEQTAWEGTPAAPDEADLKARFRWLVARVAEDGWYEATVLPQLHVYAWGNERGV